MIPRCDVAKSEALLEQALRYFGSHGWRGDPDGRALAFDIADYFEAKRRGEA